MLSSSPGSFLFSMQGQSLSKELPIPDAASLMGIDRSDSSSAPFSVSPAPCFSSQSPPFPLASASLLSTSPFPAYQIPGQPSTTSGAVMAVKRLCDQLTSLPSSEEVAHQHLFRLF